MDSVLLVIFAYLFGSILFGEHMARRKGIDLRTVGSGNVGATNVGRILGKKYAFLVFFLDVLKGLFPMLLARLYFGLDSWTASMVGIASFLGHLYPFFHGFKGGKGVATAFGVLLGISPLVSSICLVLWLLVFRLKGYVSLASLSSSAFAPFLLLILGYPVKIFLTALFMASFILYRHRDNINRLLMGQEHRFSK
ncbi:MAG: glycerol-3-phosphate 1-O-acyltransferase PlsY [Aquificaceae bacterium]